MYYALQTNDAPVIEVMQRLSGQYPPCGYRRIRVFLGREGIQVGQERCSRHTCRLAGTASGATTSDMAPVPTVRQLNVWRWWTRYIQALRPRINQHRLGAAAVALILARLRLGLSAGVTQMMAQLCALSALNERLLERRERVIYRLGRHRAGHHVIQQLLGASG